MDKRILSFLAVIVFLGAVLRFSYLTFNPPSLNWDEISHGYNAYSILKTGADQWGQKFPLFNFRAYGDYPTTLNLYLTIPFILIFGLTEFAVRFPHALIGTFLIISVYFMAWGLTKRKDISLFSAFLSATGPWYLFTSRFVLQSNLSVFLITTAAALFFNRERSKYFVPVSMGLTFLTLFAYHTTRIFSPLILIGVFVIYFKEFTFVIKKKQIQGYLLGFSFIVFLALSGYILRSPEARARSGVLFLVDQGAVNRIIKQRNGSNLPEVLKRAVYNRPAYFANRFLGNYVSYFSPNFLFLKGGTQYQFSVPGFGLIYPVSLPFFYLGLILLAAKSIKNKNWRMLLAWLILAPVPASLTNESFAVIRATTMLPIPEILTGLGLFWVFDNLKNKYKYVFLGIFLVFLYVFAEKYVLNYFTTYRTDYSWSWQYGYKEAVNYAGERYGDYDKIIVTKKYGEPHEYFLFFLKYDPAKYRDDPNAIRFFQSDWYWVDRFDKFYFVNDWQMKDLVTESKVKIECKGEKCLMITSPGNYPAGWKKLETINFLSGEAAFEIYENK